MAQAQPFAGGTKRFYRMVQELVGVTTRGAAQDLGFYEMATMVCMVMTVAAALRGAESHRLGRY